MPNCSYTSAAAACSCDDPNGTDEKRDSNGRTGFLDNYQIIRDCDKLIEAFVVEVDEHAFVDWRRLLVLNKKWNSIRPHFVRHCQDRADNEDNPRKKNKLLWLGKKLKEVCNLLGLSLVISSL